ncbi:hypothetical protein SAMN05216249_1365 [Acetitomaculum ruminis DSM 5522]|uniref:Phage transcriptional regulator, RinA family n=1 Tax=Acetitomaculum ruminis DSM 5522 TaxID=1120918 RepID=A0A1I1APF8_9FIRM|nr:hypothetical protein [Acetitomaculum ruminis]SFB39904.1 hypothetical protein SAMN05216249_1365 [Acetitomaculum ruminis DSM 5522]
MKDREKKKRFLRSYRNIISEKNRLQIKADELRLNIILPSVRYSDMPSAHNIEDRMANYVAEHDKLITKILILSQEAKNCLDLIHDRISELTDDYEKEILEKRYIQRRSWGKIIADTPYESAQVFRIHNKALDNLRLDKSDIQVILSLDNE